MYPIYLTLLREISGNLPQERKGENEQKKLKVHLRGVGFGK